MGYKSRYMSAFWVFILLVFLPLSSGGCAMATWPAKVQHHPTLSLSNYRTFSFSLPVTANVLEGEAREEIIKLLGKGGYRYVEDKERADFVVEERVLWEEKMGYTPPSVRYTPMYTPTTIIYVPTYIPERPYTYYDFYASLTFYDRVSQERIYEGKIEGTTSYLDLAEIYRDLIQQSHLPLSTGQARPLKKEVYKVYTTRYSRVYHRAGCPELGAEGLIEFQSAEEASGAGAIACGRCNP
jgi:hypothetical protein